MSKYHNRPVTVDGQRFDSAGEAGWWGQLRLLERAGEITGLERQVFTDRGGRRHVQYFKGVRTAVYRLKKRLMWHVHGIAIEEV